MDRNTTATGIVERSTADRLAREFETHTDRISELIQQLGAEVEALQTAFRFESTGAMDFELRLASHSLHNASPLTGDHAKQVAQKYRDDAKRAAWRVLVEKLGIKRLMSPSRVEKLNAALYGERYNRGSQPEELPDITPENIIGALTGMVGSVEEFVDESIAECYLWLRPGVRYANGTKYKTNGVDRVKKRAVIEYACEPGWGCAYRLGFTTIERFRALDVLFHWLDGAGIPPGHNSPLVDAVTESEDGTGETDYFGFRCFKKGNVHLTFRRLDLLAEFNRRAGAGDRLGAGK